MKPWREIAVPHNDVLRGTFQQSEFAADITAVHTGRASPEYQNPIAFFDRTYITEGMRLLLTQVAQRLAGQGGEPVIQLQTAFGGGKTHTMLAVYHLATRKCALSELAGIPALVDQSGLMDIPQARVAVLDGTAHSPGQAWKHGKQAIKTLWGELAWQLGGSDGFALVKESDVTGTSPGKEIMAQLLERFAPCVILIDELVAYIRQFPEGQTLSGGTFASNISFVQALTEAAKLVPTAIVLASLPVSVVGEEKSNLQVGGERGQTALLSLENVLQRVQALWKPVASEEGFEIVRRRLFEPLRETAARDQVCRAFADAYVAEGAQFPSETQESRYYNRLVQAYPIHPEVFDRLYEDWTTIAGFQRTRGVLKLMAKVIYALWKSDNKDLMILPGSVLLNDPGTRNELVYHLSAGGWDPVIERDIDGNKAETTELETREPRFGQLNAARRVARTIFLGSAPASMAPKPGIRGLDRARILLGCLQPGQSSAVYSDALNRLADRLHYLNSSGDKAADTTRFWFDTRANLRREMEDRKRRFDDSTEVRAKIADTLKKLAATAGYFDGAHIFTPHADVPDDGSLRLVVLPPEVPYARDFAENAEGAVLEHLRQHGTRPRQKGNRLLFLAADSTVMTRLRDAARVALAWKSIVDDVAEGRLNIDLLQQKQAQKELRVAEEVLPRAARECYKWLLCPVLNSATETRPVVEAFPLGTTAGSVASELERVCDENELVISAWSPIHLRDRLKEFFWTNGKVAVTGTAFWDACQNYLYLPRLRKRDVLEQAIRNGARTRDFFGLAAGQTGDKFEGFEFGTSDGRWHDTLLLIEPGAAGAYAAAQAPAPVDPGPGGGGGAQPDRGPTVDPGPGTRGGPQPISPPGRVGPGPEPITPPPTTTVSREFFGAVEIRADSAKVKLVEVAEEIIALLRSDPNAQVQVTLNIHAEFPEGVTEQIRRAVTENAGALGFKTKTWE